MAKFLKTYALAAVLLLGMAAWFAPRAAAQDGTLTGTVLDFDAKPWADFGVTAEGEQGAKQTVKTDASGKYTFASLKPGTYKLSVMLPLQKEPYVAAQVKVSSGQNNPIDLNLHELVAKKNPEYVAALKKQAEESKKFSGMKVHFDKGLALLDQERTAKADLNKASADQRDALKAKVNDLATQAVAEFQEAQKAAGEKDTNQHLFWARMGEAYDLAGRNDEAINAYQQAVAAKPDSAGYYNNLGNVLARAGKIDEAKAAYSKSAELDPANAALAWRNFGISLYQVGRMTEAVEPLQKATTLDPKNAQGWYLLGACLVASADYKQEKDKMVVTLKPGTVEAYQKAIELDPNGQYGAQAKQGLEAVQAMTGGIQTSVGSTAKKKKP
ncbi:MAG TPA: tetratricopeptide repeat protein [Candidatus Saccharimonadales bacterium]|nr:tetratricopeptide repeat protein [Candidatus Saccharimonadales bacterium]